MIEMVGQCTCILLQVREAEEDLNSALDEAMEELWTSDGDKDVVRK